MALVTWPVRASSLQRIQKGTGGVCDLCNGPLDGEPFAVLHLPSEEELRDPEYVPVDGTALCKTCALRFYNLRPQDVGEVERIWFCYGCVELKTR